MSDASSARLVGPRASGRVVPLPGAATAPVRQPRHWPRLLASLAPDLGHTYKGPGSVVYRLTHDMRGIDAELKAHRDLVEKLQAGLAMLQVIHANDQAVEQRLWDRVKELDDKLAADQRLNEAADLPAAIAAVRLARLRAESGAARALLREVMASNRQHVREDRAVRRELATVQAIAARLQGKREAACRRAKGWPELALLGRRLAAPSPTGGRA
jgi:hypothetical protein